MNRLFLSFLLLLFCFASHAQDDAKRQYILLNVNLNYRNFGDVNLSTAGLKIAAMPNEHWALGALAYYDKISDANQFKVGPFVRYYFIEESFRFFLGAQSSYASFNIEELSIPYLYYGPQGGFNIPLKEGLFLEILVEHLWQSPIENVPSDINSQNGRFNYDIGLTVIF